MAFTNEEILSWFCATNPLPVAAPDRVDTSIPAPGHGMHQAELAAREREREQRQAASDGVAGGRLARRRFQGVAGAGRGRWRGEEGAGRLPDLVDEPDDDCKLEDYFSTIDPHAGLSPAGETTGLDVEQASTEIYDMYAFDADGNPPGLPIAQFRDDVVRTIEANQITIIQGSTGSGKSTQVPQYILNHYAAEKKYCSIICTQPRRIAAVTLAKFVAQSRGWPLGSLVGYQIGLDRTASEDTRLLFVTTQVLLRKLISVKNMNMYTHIVIDEVGGVSRGHTHFLWTVASGLGAYVCGTCCVSVVWSEGVVLLLLLGLRVPVITSFLVPIVVNVCRFIFFVFFVLECQLTENCTCKNTL